MQFNFIGLWQKKLFFGMFLGLMLGMSSFVLADVKRTTPKGMVLVLGGSFELGSNQGRRNEKPAHKVSVPTFYLDQTEVTNQDFRRCMKAGYCYRLRGVVVPKRYLFSNAPVVYVSWYDAQRYCQWRGKRLPTAAEWEYAARGSKQRMYPWGNQKASCRKAHFNRCRPRRPIAVNKKNAEHLGLRHMAGNVSEWVNDWYAPCYSGCRGACGSFCSGNAPKGSCNGKSDCPKRLFKVLKGGSWASNRSTLRASWRQGMMPTRMSSKIGFRCASSSPILKTGGQLLQLKERKEPKRPKGGLSSAQKKIFFGTSFDNLALKKLCPKRYRSGSNCRDPIHYIKSNEKRLHLFIPYLKNIGGAYVGIGADQNYNFIAWARSSLVWLMDYDMVIYWLHKMHRGLILHSPTNKDYMDLWSKKNARKAISILRKVYKNDKERKMIVRVYRRYRRRLERYFKKEFFHKKKEMRQHWLATPRHYAHIRWLYKNDRIRPMPGDLLKFNSLRGAATAAKKLGVVVRAVYLSNAEEYWHYPPHFRESFKIMPFDAKTVIIRTLSSRRWMTKQYSYFHYNLQHGLQFKRAINEKAPKGYRGFRHRGIRELMERFRFDAPFKGFTLIGFPKE